MEPTQRSALARLLNGLKREQHDYRPSLEVFPALNIEKLAADMGLATAGAERGTREEPAAIPSATGSSSASKQRRMRRTGYFSTSCAHTRSA